MHYYKSNNEIMQYCSVSNDIALIMHYRALLKRSDPNKYLSGKFQYHSPNLAFFTIDLIY